MEGRFVGAELRDRRRDATTEEREELRMSGGTRSGLLVVALVVASAAFAPAPGDRGSGNDAAPPGVGGVGGAKNPLGAANKKPPTLDSSLVTALYRAGLQPENLTAAGVSAESTTTLVGNVKAWLAQNASTLSSADSRLGSAVPAKESLWRKVQSGLGSHDDVASLDAAVTEYNAALAGQASTVSSMFDAGTASLSSDTKATLVLERTSQLAWGLPLQYLVKDRSEADWVALRDALDNERVSAKLGEDPDPADQALLATVRADPAIAAAKTNLDTKLGAVTAAWEAAAVQQQ
jgi:hypothetical protein